MERRLATQTESVGATVQERKASGAGAVHAARSQPLALPFARPAILFAVALFLLALAPRWVARDTYVTADEDNWIRRAGGFAWGVANGRLGRTYQNGHPAF